MTGDCQKEGQDRLEEIRGHAQGEDRGQTKKEDHLLQGPDLYPQKNLKSGNTGLIVGQIKKTTAAAVIDQGQEVDTLEAAPKALLVAKANQREDFHQMLKTGTEAGTGASVAVQGQSPGKDITNRSDCGSNVKSFDDQEVVETAVMNTYAEAVEIVAVNLVEEKSQENHLVRM